MKYIHIFILLTDSLLSRTYGIHLYKIFSVHNSSYYEIQSVNLNVSMKLLYTITTVYNCSFLSYSGYIVSTISTITDVSMKFNNTYHSK